MITLDVKNAFHKHLNKVEELTENGDGTFSGGYTNFPKTKYPLLSADEFNVVSPTIRYKASRFNSYVPFEDKIVGFNAFTQRYLVMDPTLLDLLNAAMIEGDLDALGDLHPTFYGELKKLGFLVSEDEDETQKVKDLREEVDKNDHTYVLVINPTMNCNFKCWYCYESHIKGSKMDSYTIDKIKNFIANVMETNPDLEKFHISWFGGEPMLYFENVIKPIVEFANKKAKEHGIRVYSGMTTNGYLFKEQMIPFLVENNLNNYQITLDGDREKHNTIRYTANKKGSFDKIIENIKLLVQNDLYVAVRINYTEDMLETLEGIVDYFRDLTFKDKENVSFSFHKVWQDKQAPRNDYLDSIIRKFRSNGFMTSSVHYSSDTLRNSCYADKKNQATINYNGEVFKCTAREFDSKSAEGSLSENGVITWNEKQKKRLNAKFKNSPCMTCAIQPICNGGCSQVAMENEGLDYCVVENSGQTKQEVVLSRFLHKIESLLVLRSRMVYKINQRNLN